MNVRPGVWRLLRVSLARTRRVERRFCYVHKNSKGKVAFEKPKKSGNGSTDELKKYVNPSYLTWCCPSGKVSCGHPPPPNCPVPPCCPPPAKTCPPSCTIEAPPCGYCKPPGCTQPCPGSTFPCDQPTPADPCPPCGPCGPFRPCPPCCPCNHCDPCAPCNPPCYPCDPPPPPHGSCSGRRCIYPPPCCFGGPIPPNPCCPRFPTPNYKKYRLIVALLLPVIVLQTLNALGHELCPKGPCREYSYMRRRTKRFPWGDGSKSFFHNEHTNHLPDECEPPPLICRPLYDPCDD